MIGGRLQFQKGLGGSIKPAEFKWLLGFTVGSAHNCKCASADMGMTIPSINGRFLFLTCIL